MKKFLLRLALSLLIGGVMLVFYAHSRESDIDRTIHSLLNAHWWVLAPYFAAMAVQHFFRAWRWSFLLEPIHHVPLSRILPIATVGFFAIVALPLRMGELVRPYLIADPPDIRMSQGLGTMAVERVFDGLVLSLTCFLVVLEARGRTEVPGWILGAGFVAFCVFFSVLLALVMALWQKERAVALCRRLFGIVSVRLGDSMAHIAEGIVDGFKVLPDWRKVLAFLFCTLAYWGLNGVAVWVLSYGFGLDLSLWAGTGVMVVVGIGIMIPAGPGFVGNFEVFANGALGLYVGRAAKALAGEAYILSFHVTNALWYALFGTLAMLSPRVSFSKVLRATTGSAADLVGQKLDRPDAAADAGARNPAEK